MSDRNQALNWWQNLSAKEQSNIIEKWKSVPDEDYRKTWPVELIIMSKDVITNIWKQLHK
jgi:hypothetical protein